MVKKYADKSRDWINYPSGLTHSSLYVKNTLASTMAATRKNATRTSLWTFVELKDYEKVGSGGQYVWEQQVNISNAQNTREGTKCW
jgi:hypothetical protein